MSGDLAKKRTTFLFYKMQFDPLSQIVNQKHQYYQDACKEDIILGLNLICQTRILHFNMPGDFVHITIWETLSWTWKLTMQGNWYITSATKEFIIQRR